MKACDTQWTKTIETEPRYIPSISHHEMFEMGWRGALERALKAGREEGLEHFVSVRWIEQELENL